jgi:PAS domain S-box-containing protein
VSARVDQPESSAVGQVIVGGGEMGERMRAFDWSATPLGPVAGWPQSLRSAVSILLASRAQIVLFWGPDLVALYNDAYRPVFGAKHPWALGKPARECWSEVWNVLGPLFGGVVSTGQAFWAQDHPFFLQRHGFSEETYFDVSYDPIRVEGGGVGGLFCIVTETTGRVLGERRLRTLRELSTRTSEAPTALAVGAAAADVLAGNPADFPFALIYLLDDGGRARLAGASGVAAAGLDRVLSLAAHPQVAAALADGRTVEVAAARFVSRPPAAARETALVLPLTAGLKSAGVVIAGASQALALEGDYRALFDLVAGRVSAALAGVRALDEERRRADALAELDRAKTDFFSNVSHEFRTPLTLMLSPLEEALAAAELPPAERERLTVVHRNGLRLLKLVNSLLDFSRIEAGRAQAAYEPVDLGTVTAHVASAFRSAVERAHLRLEVDCPTLAEPVWVDREMWEKIVLNLLSNAFKFTFEGGIVVRVRDGADAVALEVSDTGTGIEPAEQAQIFERFHRVRDARSRSHEGSGIGLSLVQELARLHGGTVAVQSVPGAGSTFTVTLPRGTAHLPPERLRAARGVISTDPGSARLAGGVAAAAYADEALRWLADDGVEETATPASAGGRVLVADDNADMRDYLRRLLGRHWAVEVAADGTTALASALARPPDLVLSDVMMPGLDGFGLVASLRRDARTAGVPIILLSARAGEESRVDGVAAGADDYLVKPFAARELLARVNTHLVLARARNAAEQAARRSGAEMEDFFENSVLALHWVGPDGTILRANRAELEMLGYAREEYVGRHVADFHVDREVIDDVLRRLATGESIHNRPARMRCKDGSLRHVLISSNVLWEDGRFVHTRCFTRDVTELKLAEQERERLLAEAQAARAVAEQASRAKDEFLAMLSHELRNPLGVIVSGVDILDRIGAMSADAVRARGLVRRQTTQLARLLDDLLDVARITRGRIELRRETIDFRAVVERAIDTVRPRLTAARQRLDVGAGDDPVWVHADPARLQQVVENLLVNASKYTPGDGHVSVALGRERLQARLTVRDTGIGIPPERLDSIFDLFVQLDTPLARSDGGLGIGLTLVRRLVEQHDGRVVARSEGLGKGSELVVWLPLSQPPASSAGDAPPSARALARRRVLVVEDNDDAREALRLGLSLEGHEVDVAADGHEGLALGVARRPDVAVVDVGLPGRNGYEVGRGLRAALGERITLIALTGYGQADDRARTLEAGFDAHLTKPATVEDVLRILGER